MKKTRIAAWLVLALGAGGSAQAQSTGMLFDQNDEARSSSAYAISSSYYYGYYSSELADDFVVPAGETWDISNIEIDIDQSGAPAANFVIMTNASGLPGTAVSGCSAANVTPASSTSITGGARVSYNLSWSCSLESGTYWLMTTAGNTAIFMWHGSAGTAGNAAAARPSGDFWGSCRSTTWTTVPSCITNGVTPPVQFHFTLSGSSSVACAADDTTCDGVDDDCDTLIDEDAPTATYYADADGDDYGDNNDTNLSCSQPTGYVPAAGDCDDSDAAVNPDAIESCNDVDDDCDTVVDDGVTTTFYADADTDTYGDAAVTTEACSAPTGYVANADDCDDQVATTNPGATETCNAVDDDCDLTVDEGVQTTFYADPDADTYGDGSVTTEACTAPTGYVAIAGDCDSTRATVYPGAPETCNGLDDDCDSVPDDGVLTVFYLDSDSDGFGVSTSTASACTLPTGFATVAGDCDDQVATTNPGATETCNAVDDDCDLTVDDGVQTTFYADPDADTYGDGSVTTEACTAPTGYVAIAGDCDSTRATVYPGAPETCNGLDDDCDSVPDDGVLTVFYLDSDSDGFGVSTSTASACTLPTGFATVAGDCDDQVATTNPGATETCNGVDDDCDLTVDDGVQTTFYADPDADTYGDGSVTTEACTAPTGYVAIAGDCDSTRATVYPGAAETCNGLDDDCDLTVDDGVQTIFYADGDADGFGDSNSTASACTLPTGYATVGGDCDNNAPTVYPGAPETCNEVDDDCDSVTDDGVQTTFYADVDLDGYGDNTDSVQACTAPSGYITLGGDCDDTTDEVNPGEVDTSCNQIDNDCSGTPDDGDTDQDSTPDCSEECDTDADKTAPGVCGCGLADSETQDPACGGGDADQDGLFNDDECADPSDCQDTDGDDTPDYLDTDSDGDELLDSDECVAGVCSDTDQDGLNDQLERNDADSDGDGTTDDQDLDSDDDDLDDGEECVDGVCLDEDDDGIRDHLDDSFGDGDLDDDSIPDSTECATQPCVDFDDDGIPDYGDTDSDDDTVLDGADSARLDPCVPNPNALACLSGDFDNDGVPNGTDIDPSDACKPSTDAVACATGDTDDDGVLNGADPAPTNACDPNPNALACPGGDTDGDTTPNSSDPAPSDPCRPNANAVACPTGDYDNDGTPNASDSAPKDACIPTINVLACPTGDNDSDGTVNGSDAAPLDPCIPTTDALACGTGDTDRDGTNNQDDPAPQDPCNPNEYLLVCPTGDTDADGVKNGEDPEPENSCAPSEDVLACSTGDRDGDGVPNGTDPAPVDECDPNPCEEPEPEPGDDAGAGPVDSDGDGVSDEEECGGKKKCPDTDGDGKPDNEDTDDDGDGIPTQVEDDTADELDLPDDIDGDGLPNSLDPDADGDGILDGDEVADRDGDGTPDVFDPDQVQLSGGSACSLSTESAGTDLASWPLLSLLGLLFWHRRRTG